MTAKRLYENFCRLFGWFVPHVTKFKENRTDGGIDIFLDTGEVMNFQADKSYGWILRRSAK